MGGSHWITTAVIQDETKVKFKDTRREGPKKLRKISVFVVVSESI